MSVPRSHRNRPNRHLAAVGPEDIWPESPYIPADDMRDAYWPPCAPPEPRPELFSGLLPFVDDFAALLDLNADPIPDEPFDWTHVDELDRPIVAAALERVDVACDAVLDTEYRTIARRIPALVATRDPRPLRRTTNHNRLAAGIVWLAGRGSGEFGRRAPRWRSSRTLGDLLDVTNCAERGHSIRNAAGLVPEPDNFRGTTLDALPLGSVALLHSGARAGLIVQRDARLRIERERRQWSLSPDGNQVACRAAVVGPIAVTPARAAESDQALVLVTLGGPNTELDDADLYALSLPDARRLVDMLRRAIS